MDKFTEQFNSVFLDETDTFKHSKALEEAIDIAERRLIHRTIMPAKSLINEDLLYTSNKYNDCTGFQAKIIAIDELDSIPKSASDENIYPINIFATSKDYDKNHTEMIKKLFDGKFLKNGK